MFFLYISKNKEMGLHVDLGPEYSLRDLRLAPSLKLGSFKLGGAVS